MAGSFKRQNGIIKDNMEDPQKGIIIKEKDNAENTSSSGKNPIMDNYNDNNPLSLSFTDLKEAIIYSEILRKPRCKSRGRWR